MKKIISILAICLTTVVVFNACSDSDFDEKFADPSKTSTVTVEKLMTGTFEKGNLYTMQWYWRYYTFEIPQMGKYAQVMGFLNGSGRYELKESYNNDRWTNFYKVLAQYRLLESTLEGMEESQKPLYEVFQKITLVYVYDHLHQLVDLWGDVPFNEAGFLGLTGDIRGSKPKYDSAEDLYKQMMNDLKSINSYLTGYSPNTIVNTYLQKQDYINGGDLMAWRRYANSLRLRIASRAAENGSLTAEARGVIAEILGDPTTYPVVTTNGENIRIDYQAPKLTAVEEQHEKGIQGGFESSAGSYNRASKAYMDALAGDPRLDIIYDRNRDGEYVGIDPMMSSTDQDKLFNRPNAEGGNYFSAVDTATFSRNNKFPGVIFTASEVDFIRAEAIQKWGLSGNAEEAFKRGVKNSIEFYFYLNSLGDYREPLPAPSAAEVDEFTASKWNAYGSKEEAIATQRWIHHGMVQMVQAWNEYRKTGYPALTFQSDPGSVNVPTPPTRLRYTTDERNYNTENYQSQVVSKDDYYTKLFWAK